MTQNPGTALTTTTPSDLAPGSAAPEAGLVRRDEFGAQQTLMQAETAAAAVAAQAKAAVEARFVVALRRPRDMDDVRVRMLKECRRPSFAPVARYAKPIGGGTVEGWSIRFAEAALRTLGNVATEVTTLYDDARKRILEVSVTDLESNLTFSQQVVIDKTVERSNAKGRTVLQVRMNAQNREVFIVAATEDELLVKQGALVSKAIRNLGLRLLPGDILDEAEEIVKATAKNAAAKDPDQERKRLVDAFAAVGVKPSDLKGYLGHETETLSPAELVHLREVYVAMKEGDATWQEVVAARAKDEERPAEPAKSTSQAVKDALRKGKEKGANGATKPNGGAALQQPEPPPAPEPSPEEQAQWAEEEARASRG